MDARFLSAFTDPAPVRMLGRIVYPFCLKHRVRLMAMGSPLMSSGNVSPQDYYVAVLTCAEEPIRPPGLIDSWRLNELTENPIKFTRELLRFSDYVMVQHWPKFWENNTKKGTAGHGIPWPMMVATNLIASGIPEQRAWEMPECQAIWMNVAFAARKGVEVNVLSTEEEELMESIRLASQQEVKTTDEPRNGIPAEGEK
jgi:hypothetical protein